MRSSAAQKHLDPKVQPLPWMTPLIVPETATAGGSSPRLCVDRACPGLMLPFYWWLLYWNTHSVCGLFFDKLHAQLEV